MELRNVAVINERVLQTRDDVQRLDTYSLIASFTNGFEPLICRIVFFACFLKPFADAELGGEGHIDISIGETLSKGIAQCRKGFVWPFIGTPKSD